MTLNVSITVPENLFNLTAFVSSVKSAMDSVLNETAKDFSATFATWSDKSKPDLVIDRPKQQSHSITGGVRVIGEIYSLVNNGTGVRTRTAKNKPYLRFRRNYHAKTAPGHIVPGPSSRSGGWVRKRSVNSGPILPRKFDDTIAKARSPDFYRAMNACIDAATK